MAGGASHVQSAVSGLFVKHAPIVAAHAQFRFRRLQHPGVFAGMWVVAGGASHLQGGVSGLLVKHCLLMAAHAEGVPAFRQSLIALELMGDVCGVHAGVA